MTQPETLPSVEVELEPSSGWPILIGLILAVPAVILASAGISGSSEAGAALIVTVGLVLAFIAMFGFYVVPPNLSRVMVLFGDYKGTVRKTGFWFINPFTSKHKLSLRAHNVASEKIKVNDATGNPIEIGAVVVWRIRDTAMATFDVEDYTEYVDIQIETALRRLAGQHPYDEKDADSGEVSLRGDQSEVTAELQDELAARLERAGVEVLEARISHLAYAPEIASAMLQRQQAQAIISARKQIVEGAVGMVEDALNQLSKANIVELDDERRATLVGNLLVVLCGQENAQPVLNTGSLHK